MSKHDPAAPAAPTDVYTVTRLNGEVRATLEERFGQVWIEGEISNLARPRSGHVYFSLKDERAQVRCAMFRMHNQRLDFPLDNGRQVLANARVSLYPDRGEFQLVVHYLEEAGEGALRRAFEALKQRLSDEGLFDAATKRPLPTLARRIGVVTSPTGAAFRDVAAVLARRFPAIPVLLYPVPVQGEGAAREIARMLDMAGQRGECDVLILTRGGGSLEDLWAFNEEVLARAIHRCTIPIVTGVGHEVDFTIADFAADLRAATPSAAAEIASPDGAEWRQAFGVLAERCRRLASAALDERRQALGWLRRRLADPERRLLDLSQRLDSAQLRLVHAVQNAPAKRRGTLAGLAMRLQRRDPALTIGAARARWQQLRLRMQNALGKRVDHDRMRLAGLERALQAISPNRTLERGYAIVSRADDGRLLRTASAVSPGEAVDARLATGTLRCRVDEVDAPR